jgi:hypothetical protein
MTTATHREPAKIYEFPAGGRASRTRSGARELPQMTAPKLAEVEYGDCWYHDAAIEEAEYVTTLARPVRLFTDRI